MRYVLIVMAFTFASSMVTAKELATFGKHTITEKDFLEAVERLGPQGEMIKNNPQMKQRFLDHLINRSLLADKAKAEKVDRSARYKEVVKELELEALSNIFLEQYIETNASEKKMKEYFEKNKKLFAKDEVKASHILMDDEAKAKAVLAEAQKKGANFEELAKKNSKDPSSSNGGDLGWFSRGRMVPEFEEAAFAAKKGEVYPKLVKTQFGFHIIKVTDKKGDGKASYDDSKEDVERRMKRELQEKLIDDLRASSKLKVNESNLEALKL